MSKFNTMSVGRGCKMCRTNMVHIVVHDYDCSDDKVIHLICNECKSKYVKANPNEKINFGKYKGKTCHDVFMEDYKYAKWCYENVQRCPNYFRIVFSCV